MDLHNQPVGTSQLLRALALHADSITTATLDCGTVWNSLIRGDKQIADSFLAHQRCYLVLTEREAQNPLDRRLLEVLERTLLLAEPQKVVALDLNTTASTIAQRSRQGLAFMGLTCRSSRVPALLIMLGFGARHGCPLRDGRVSELVLGARKYYVVGASRPDCTFGDRLTSAERDVLRLLVDGYSHVEIAAQRGTSKHTVANQLGDAFKRLGVSGRLELLVSLCTERAVPRFATRFGNSDAGAPEMAPALSA